mmetsp:Transcript_5269/g.11029  ORF Transcript_5269/g.11029 Transcript_5269/m.11029 type:complete len:90 (-) Transcript_5269:1522-1791(-)
MLTRSVGPPPLVPLLPPDKEELSAFPGAPARFRLALHAVPPPEEEEKSRELNLDESSKSDMRDMRLKFDMTDWPEAIMDSIAALNESWD